tara:strand:+ start:164 stop:544 length:381 start_codon:yes stop_codon:yes gene_type:complete
MTHSMKLKDPHFRNVLEGKKIYELRLYDEKRKAMNVGDVITIKHNDNSHNCYNVVITDIKVFTSFKKAIKDSGFDKVIPDAQNLNDAVGIYLNIPNYPEGESKYGVVRFTFVLQNVLKNVHLLNIQ